MLITGAKLRALVTDEGLCDHADSIEESSLTLRVADLFAFPVASMKEFSLSATRKLIEGAFERESAGQDGVVLNPRDCVLACSRERLAVPSGYFCFVQTRGTLARLFVAVHCNDAQIDTGYSGRVTFEIVNLGPFRVRIRPEDAVARLFVFQTSDKATVPYSGRYQGATEPTLPKTFLTD